MQTVNCAGCGRELDEPAKAQDGERTPCPACGSTAPRSVSVTIRVGLGEADDTLAASGSVGAGSPRLEQRLQVTVTAPETRRFLVLIRPTDSEGSYTVVAYNAEKELLDITEEPTLDDALLAMADERLWSS